MSKRRTGTASGNVRLRISKRVVNSRRHTQGYMIGGRYVTTAQARKLAEQGRLTGVRVVGEHIQSEVGSRRLSDLPTEVRK